MNSGMLARRASHPQGNGPRHARARRTLTLTLTLILTRTQARGRQWARWHRSQLTMPQTAPWRGEQSHRASHNHSALPEPARRTRVRGQVCGRVTRISRVRLVDRHSVASLDLLFNSPYTHPSTPYTRQCMALGARTSRAIGTRKTLEISPSTRKVDGSGRPTASVRSGKQRAPAGQSKP